MGSKVAQDNRPLAVKTPLPGKDTLILTGFSGSEGISQLYNYRLDTVCENADLDKVKFEVLLGKEITVELELPGSTSPREKKRFYSGICSRVVQGQQDSNFTAFSLEIVPRLWLLTRRARSRVFYQPHDKNTVPEIVKAVLKEHGIDDSNSSFKLQGTFEPREYCVQYRETDFNFVSRLLEEEGIYYFFVHGNQSHQIVFANSPDSHPAVSPATANFAPSTGAVQSQDLVLSWEKSQQLRSAKYALRDYHFQKPDEDFPESDPIQNSVTAGTKTHDLTAGGSPNLEIYDGFGDFAHRFDGVDAGGEGSLRRHRQDQ
jgi:type VI secretion system secreted protein VgrG